jgi:ketosteroid isomerase-like protein
MTDAHQTVVDYWAAAEKRDWAAFGGLLAGDVVYDLPQTRERIRGRAAFLQFNEEYPGDWHVTVERAVGEGRHAATWMRFAIAGEEQPALTFFELDGDGLITQITDFWPEPYEPPPGREHLAHLVERY